VNHAGVTLKSEGRGGIFRVFTVPGEVDLLVLSVPEELPYGLASEEFHVRAGFQRFELPLTLRASIHIVLKDGRAVLPNSTFDTVRVLAREVDGSGRILMNATRTHGRLHLTGPGTYHVGILGAPDGYRPVEPRRVEVRAGAVTELVIELERR
jgi:hypothetical protein